MSSLPKPSSHVIAVLTCAAVLAALGCRDETLKTPSGNRYTDGNGDTDADVDLDTDTCNSGGCLADSEIVDTAIEADSDTCADDLCRTPTDTDSGDTETSFYVNPLGPLIADASCDLSPTTMECNYYICTIGVSGMSIQPADCTSIESYCAALVRCYVDFTLCIKETCPVGTEITADFADDYDDCYVIFEACMTAAMDEI